MSAKRGQRSRAGLNRSNSTEDTGPRRRGRYAWRDRPALSRWLKGILGAEVAVIVALLIVVGMGVIPRLASTTTTTATITQVGASTTFESTRAATAITSVPAGTASGDVLLTFVETSRGSSVRCTSGARLILDRSHGGTQLAACLSVTGQSVPSQVRVRVSRWRGTGVVATTMAFAGVDQSSPVDVMATSSSSTSPSVTMSGSGLIVFGLGSSGLAAVATPPSGTLLQATVNDSGHAQVAAATRSGSQGTSGAGKWGLAPSSHPVGATVALLAAPVTVVSPATTSTSTSPATTSPATTSTSPATTSPAITAPTSDPTPTPTPTPTSTSSSSGAAPSSPPVTWCETGLPTSPYTSAPTGSVTVPAGDNSSFDFSTANTTYWFAPGTHTLGTGMYDQIQPADGDTYVGAPGAVLDGQNDNHSAFVGNYQDLGDENVTIEYLTIENFDPTQNGGAVNGNGNNGWTEKYDLMEDNSPGAAMMLGGDNVVSDNCLTENGQYGFNGYSYVNETYGSTFTGGAIGITFTGNDVSDNNTQETTSGVEGGGKFWQDGNVTVTGNYVHNNIDSAGIWMDTDNAGFLVQDNYISDNDSEGLMYEISYNADIVDNTFIDNGIKEGQTNAGFPTGAIYVSESGGNASVPSDYAGELNIADNVFSDNWAGVVVYQNANRHSGDGQDPGTLTPPAGTSVDTWITTATTLCPANLSETSPIDYNSLCQWRSQNVSVQDNTFTFNPSDAVYGGACTTSSSCGENGLFSVVSSTSAYPGWSVINDISNNQNNHFTDNTYTGPWTFMYFNQGDTESWSAWQAGSTNVQDTGLNFGAQDQGSTLTS